ALSNALKSRGFRRPPGSPRLITRLRRIKEIEVSRGGTIRLLEGSAPTGVAEAPDDPLYEGESGTVVEAEAGEETMGEEEISTGESASSAEPARPRRRRRRGGRRRRGRGGQASAPPP